MVVAFAIPASALENEFGGFWDARFQTQKYYDGLDSTDLGGVDDTQQNVESRTRLYYTAKINDNLKLVNKFEMDATWGASTYGNVGADAIAIEIKNTYADFNVGPTNWTVGTQGYSLFNDYYISNDASGVIARWKVLDNLVLAAAWLKAFEAAAGDSGNRENEDIDSYTLSAGIWFNENISIKPSLNWITASYVWAPVAAANGFTLPVGVDGEDLDIYTYGADFNMAYDAWGLWATAVGQTGTFNTTGRDVDFSGYLLALGGNVMLGGFDIYAEGAYASGNDSDPAVSGDYEAFYNPNGSHVWSELLSDGTLWGKNPSPSGTYDVVTNLWYVGGGFKWSPMDKLTLNPSVWYASFAEDNALGDDVLGTEVDMVVTYQLVEGLNLQLIGAYLFAGDALVSAAGTALGEDNQEDAYEYGLRLSLSF
jgi:hypothetical protein